MSQMITDLFRLSYPQSGSYSCLITELLQELTRWMPQMEQELLTLSVAHEFVLGCFFVFCFLLCFCLFVCWFLFFFPISEVRVVQVTKLHVFTFLVPFCDFRHDFLVKTTFVRLDSDFFFGLHVLFMLLLFIYRYLRTASVA